LEAGGPTSLVTALAFSRDGKTLYAGGLDKVVRVWSLDVGQGRFVPDRAAYRVPIGPGVDGAINALALSPDDTWLAVAGSGVIRGGADFRQTGVMVPTASLSREMREDEGIIHVFHTPTGRVQPLRGHLGPVRSLAFAPTHPGKPPLLISAGRERAEKSGADGGVVRLWDVAKGAELGKLANLPLGSVRPGLAAWHTGPQTKQLRVAIAWYDDQLRVWDVERGAAQPWAASDAKYNNNVVYVPDRGKLLTGGLSWTPQLRSGRLQLWDVAAGQAPRADTQGTVPVPAHEGAYCFPQALALLSARADGKLDHAAMVLRAPDRGEEYLLRVVDLSPGKLGARKAQVTLWKGAARQPVLAAAPNGRHLAVAQSKDHEILVFPVERLLNNRGQPQRLRSAGAAFPTVAFVRRGEGKEKDLGLLLSEVGKKEPGQPARDPGSNDLIFDFANGRLTADRSGWKTTPAALQGWRAGHSAVHKDARGHITQWAIALRQGEGPERRVLLKENQELTDYALLPARPPHNVPILAVAFLDELRQPLLWLYHAGTGEPLRHYTGHQDPIRSLAFSDDGGLLASAADDQTVCVWSLNCLDSLVGRRGGLTGVAVQEAVAVRRIDRDSPAAGRLRIDDRIEGLVQGGRLRRTGSSHALYEALAQAKPSQAVTLQVLDGQGRPRQVEIVLRHGFDERSGSLLLGLGARDALAATVLAGASRSFSPVPGLAVLDSLFVGQVEKDGPAWQKLAEGAWIDGIMQGDRLQRLANLVDFYEAVTQTRPKAELVLQVREAAGNRRRVALVVGQGVDERKPLLSVFVTQGRGAQEREWVGWNPHGPYDASDRRAERHIGWHFNTGNPAAPASFALVDQYRKEYYRPGILKHLVAHASLAPALKAWDAEEKAKPLPRPKMTLWIGDRGPDPRQLDRQGQLLVRTLRPTLHLAIHDFPLDRAAAVEWQLDGGQRRAFGPASGPYRAVEIPLPAKRGTYSVRVVLRTDEAAPQEYAQELTLRYQPPPPAVLTNLGGLGPLLGLGGAGRLIVDKPEFNLQALLLPAADATIQMVHRHQNKDLLAETRVLNKPFKLAQAVRLQPGDNVVEIVAANKEALGGYEEFEASRVSLMVRYLPPEVRVPPPQLALEQVVVMSSATGERLSVEPGKAVVVDHPRIRIEGRIQAAAPLTRAEQGRAGEAGKTLAGFDPRRTPRELRIAEEIQLEPGPQWIRFRAASGEQADAVAEAAVTIDYRPRLPEFELTEPSPGLVVYGDKAVTEIALKGRLIPTTATRLESAAFLVDGREVPAPATVDPQGQTLTARVPLQPGSHRVQVKLRNRWREAWVADIPLRYARPPRVLSVEGPRETAKPLVDLRARVQSPLPLLPEAVKAEVNGREIASVRILPPDPARGESAWTVHLHDVPLEPGPDPAHPGTNEVRLVVGNAEAQSREPGTLTVLYRPPAQALGRPEVFIVQPAQDISVTEPLQTLRFRVRSDSPLQRVELVWEEGVPARQSFGIAGRRPNAQGFYEFEAPVHLLPRNNRFRVEAINAGGQQQAAVVVNYLYTPVRLEVVELTPKGARDERIPVEHAAGGKLIVAKAAPHGQLWLHGYVTWEKADDEQLRKARWVRVHVNGALQRPAELEPPVGDSRKRAFKAELFLNRPNDNQIEIDLPDCKQEAANRRAFALGCRNPERDQRLHLLVVGIGEKDEQQLIDRALQTLQARANAPGQIQTPAFEQVRIYGPLTGYVSPEHVFTQLCLIKRTIDLLASSGSSNDVVMVYYQGGEAVNPQGHFFLTSVSRYDKELQRSAITCDGLADSFADTLGAKILLLDVERQLAPKAVTTAVVKDRLVQWPDDSHIGVFRYAHTEPGNGRREARLLTDLKEAMQTRSKLKDVESYVAEKFPRSVVIYNRYYPASLAELIVSRGR
jgi:WD40 repeat protein